MNTLTDCYNFNLTYLRRSRHPHTVLEIGRAVQEFIQWWGSDPDMETITPELFEQFENDGDDQRRRQLGSYLRGLLRRYDRHAFPHRNRGLAIREREDVSPDAAIGDSKPDIFLAFARSYVLQRVLCEDYANTLQHRAARFQFWTGKSAIQEVLTEDNLNGFLRAMDPNGSTYTRNKWRQDILTMWRAAADLDLVPYPNARRIRREKPVRKPIECFSTDEARSLLAAAGRMKGAFENGLARRHYWPAMIRFAWDTGLRRGDCWRFERRMLQPDGSFRIVQNKTQKPIRRMLRPETVAALDKIDSPTPLEWSQCDRNFAIEFNRILTLAGVERGTFRWLRRACGSHIEAEHPGGGCKALGNTSQVFGQHYDAELATEVYLPPAL